jgi:hypothetical protein
LYEELYIERTDPLPQYWREWENNVCCRVTIITILNKVKKTVSRILPLLLRGGNGNSVGSGFSSAPHISKGDNSWQVVGLTGGSAGRDGS